MNHKIWTSAGARVLALTFVLAGAGACGDQLSDTSAQTSGDSPKQSSAQVIGQAPMEPGQGRDTAATTAPLGARGEVSEQAESTQRPLEGDNHSYSTLAETTPQKANRANLTGDGAGGETGEGTKK